MESAGLNLGLVWAMMLGGLGFLGAGLGIFRAGMSAGQFFRSAGETMRKLPQLMEDQAAAQRAMVHSNDRQADALERTSNLVPLLEKLQEEREQTGTTLRSVCRELRELKSWIQNPSGDAASGGAE